MKYLKSESHDNISHGFLNLQDHDLSNSEFGFRIV